MPELDRGSIISLPACNRPCTTRATNGKMSTGKNLPMNSVHLAVVARFIAPLSLVSCLCTCTEAWVGVKFRWGLAMDPAEKATVDSVLAGGPADLVPLPDRVD